MKIKKIRVVYVVILAMLLFASVVYMQNVINHQIQKKEVVLDYDWKIQINDRVYEDQTLSEFSVPKLYKGDQVIISRRLPNTEYSQAVIQLYSRYSSMEVYLDGQLLHQYGADMYKKGEVLGSGYQWVALPERYPGNEFRVVYHIGEKNAFASFDPIQIVNSVEMTDGLIGQSAVTGVIACSLIVIGFFSIVYVVLLGKGDPRFQMLFWLGVFSIAISMWMLASSRLIELLFKNLQQICYIEYFSMYLACASMLFFVAVFFQDRRAKRLSWCMAVIFMLLSAGMISLNVTNTIHFPKTVPVFHGVALFFAVVIMVCLAFEYRRHKDAERAFLFGIVCFFICMVLELIRYRYNKMCNPLYIIRQSMIPIGAILFTISMFGSFFLRVLERVAEELERKTLYDMAYQDSLTGINNRAWCEKTMDEFAKEERAITIINLDLNLFKEVNDTFGHAIGDELLIRFAKVLEEVFADAVCVGRMGGDEFIVIDDCQAEIEVVQKIEKLLECIEQENQKEEYAYQISVSYGYASTMEDCTVSPWKIYEKADEKMYAFKKETRK